VVVFRLCFDPFQNTALAPPPRGCQFRQREVQSIQEQTEIGCSRIRNDPSQGYQIGMVVKGLVVVATKVVVVFVVVVAVVVCAVVVVVVGMMMMMICGRGGFGGGGTTPTTTIATLFYVIQLL